MSNFKETSVSGFDPKFGPKFSPDETYWNALSFPVTAKELGPITYIDFAPVQSRVFAASTSTKVQIYNTVTSQVQRTLSKFHEQAYGGSFRRDGKLLVAGGEEGRIRLFDIEGKSLLRTFQQHTAATHLCKFMMDNVRMASFSDDKSSIVWDVLSETALLTYNEHEDYVRAGAVSTVNDNIFISGSYDHKVKMFDTRTSKNTMEVDHGSPVESVLIFPSGGVIISAGGTEINVWDVLTGGRLIAKISQHHKTITCLSLTANNRRLLSGSLDKHVKIYDLNTYNVVHTLNFSSAILSLGISENDGTLAVGMVDGLLSIQNRIEASSTKTTSKSKVKQQGRKIEENSRMIYVERHARRQERVHDTFLRKFQVSKALDMVIQKHQTKEPEVAMAVIQELIRRGSIRAAVGGKESKDIATLFSFIRRHLTNPLYSRLMLDFANIVLDIYSETILSSEKLANQCKSLRNDVAMELENMKNMMAIGGAIDLLISSASTNKLSSDNSVPVVHQ